jgi:choline-sulfatase
MTDSYQARSFSAALLLMFFFVGARAFAEKPNIVFVMTDDQAPWAIGISGNKQASTPNMDRLFREGAYLKNCFVVTPVCSPSRASLMTSQYGSELGITDWIHPGNEPKLGLDPKIVTWPEVLQKAGYRTGLVGKWHLGVPDRYHPTRNGFDYFMGLKEGGCSPVDPVLEVDGKERKLKGLTVDLITDHALKFIEKNKSGPFMLSVHYRAPHERWLPVADEDMAPYKDRDMEIPNPDYKGLDVAKTKQWMAEYLASVSGVDRNLGRILKSIDDHGLRDNTIVIFTSDHGYNMGHNGIWHKGNGHWILKEPPPATANIPSGQRPNLYDNSLRVPTAVRWPGKIQAGTEIESTITTLDWYPTLVAMADAGLPAKQVIRGRNALPLMLGKKIAWNDDFYAEYSTHHQSRTHMRMFRTKDWKLVRDFLNPERDEFFDLRSDLSETTNMVRDTAPIIQNSIKELHGRILERMAETGDAVLRSRAVQPLRGLYITGGCCHDYVTQEVAFSMGMSARLNVEWDFVRALVEGGELPMPAELTGTNWAQPYDIVIHNQCWAAYKDAEGINDFVEAQKRAGAGVMVIHCAMHTFREGRTPEWDRLVGVESIAHGPRLPIVTTKLEPDHVILKGVPDKWLVREGELYMTTPLPTATPLLEGVQPEDPNGKRQVCVWLNNYDDTRTFGVTLGHFNSTFLDPIWLDMVARGLLWSCDKLGEDGEPMAGYAGTGAGGAEASVVNALRAVQ